MLKAKILEMVKGFIDEWLLGFDESDFDVGIFSSEKFNL
jgi:hypothetical protein